MASGASSVASARSISSSIMNTFLAAVAIVVLLSHSAAARIFNPIFREYIGLQFRGVKFDDVPINPDVEFHFLLSFAMDYTTTIGSSRPTGGQFNIFWDADRLSASAVAAIKRKHPNVKVAVSLGWDKVNDVAAYFDPFWIDAWVNNAMTSLLPVLQQYHVDGLDVNYQHFRADPDTFAECVGRLLTAMKSVGQISFASIAPSEDAEIERYYQALWKKYSDVIDYVNFQFYCYPLTTNASQFLRYYGAQREKYSGGKVLAGFMSNQREGFTPDDGFLAACGALRSQGKLLGIFVWSADDSMNNEFKFEKEAQELLTSRWNASSL